MFIAALAAACGDTSEPSDDDVPLPKRDAGGDEASTQCGEAPVDLSTDVKNCGACKRVCAGGAHSVPSCAAGTCVLACDAGFADCNGQPADGCEVELAKDVKSCGACGRACTACGGTACVDGVCDAKTVVTATDAGITHVTADKTRVYFVTPKNVQQVEKDGSNLATVFGATDSTGVGVDELVNLVVPGSTASSGIYRTTAGFVGPQIAYIAQGKNVLALAVDATGLYYAVEKTSSVTEIARCNKCNGNQTVLLPTENAVGVAGIAVDTTTVFLGAGDTIRRVEKTGSDPKTLVVGQTPRSLATDETHVYWINKTPDVFFGDAGPPTSEVVRMVKAGGPVEKLATALRAPLFLAVGPSAIYFSDRGLAKANEGTIVRLSPDGKSRLVLARGLQAAGGIAVDDTCVYFADDATIKKVTR